MGVQSFLRDAPLTYRSDEFRLVLRQAERVAPTDHAVLIEGESGTGKERIARVIHELSSRRKGPYRIWSASETPSSVAASNLFGVIRGAFTGADRNLRGIIESTGGGTLVMDDIDKLDLAVQRHLLRFMDDLTIRRVGSTADVKVDLRLIFTTNRSLPKLVAAGLFLQDLYYRLCAVRINVPPLRHRPKDIAPLVKYMAGQLAAEMTFSCPPLLPEAISVFEAQPWPGNVRELASAMQNLLTRGASNGAFTAEEANEAIEGMGSDNSSRTREEWNRLRSLPVLQRRSEGVLRIAMALTGGNGREAARALRLPERSFRRYVRKYGLGNHSTRIKIPFEGDVQVGPEA